MFICDLPTFRRFSYDTLEFYHERTKSVQWNYYACISSYNYNESESTPWNCHHAGTTTTYWRLKRHGHFPMATDTLDASWTLHHGHWYTWHFMNASASWMLSRGYWCNWNFMNAFSWLLIQLKLHECFLMAIATTVLILVENKWSVMLQTLPRGYWYYFWTTQMEKSSLHIGGTTTVTLTIQS